MQIADRCVATFHYTLTNEAGEVIDSSSGSDPLAYLHGRGGIVPGLERAMTGRAAGDTFKVAVAPEDGYGEHRDDLVQVVPRSAFQGVDDLQPGMQFEARSSEGPMAVTVTAVEGDQVVVDGNHPLAGETLYFEIEVTEVREASVEEVVHGHVHGPGGHHHG
jgi:FKBP-type peptidyl-prolyl cis-trans isomerase SlyD